MENANVSIIDKFGRLAVPKKIRARLGTNKIEFVVCGNESAVKLVPVRDISEFRGKFKGVLKDFNRFHNRKFSDFE
jgi:bifunctional DNA-binding transcriptional regulator/antitoxin component of YhaV-PrlF toxin-antitoxin module